MLTKPEPAERVWPLEPVAAPPRVGMPAVSPRRASRASIDRGRTLSNGLLATAHNGRAAGTREAAAPAADVEVAQLVLVGGPQLVRSMVAGMLDSQPGMRVERSFESVAALEAHCRAAAMHCDVVLLDVDDAPGECVEVVDRVLALGLRCKLVLLSAESTDEIVCCASLRRVDGVVLKESSAADLHDAIAHIRTGHAVMPARWHAVPDVAELTPRHLDVLELVAQGYTTEEIASRLGLRPNTVKFHISEIFRRLGARNRIEAITVLAGTSRQLVH
jgi:DNA-binding NarL/FixJ family response regulator